MTEDQIKHMVDRFLGWRLPENFNPDGGVSFQKRTPISGRLNEPTGTNLLDATQAEVMVRYMVEALLAPPAGVGADYDREAWPYLWRWVERGLFDKTGSAKQALEVMLHHPSAPWNNGEWDVSHTPYAEAFYAKFPKARPAPLV